MTGGFPRKSAAGPAPPVPASDLRPVDPRAGAVDRAVPGSHVHWHALGRPLEMLEFNRLQSTMSGVLPVHDGDTAKLCEYAAKAGRADAEEFLSAGEGEVPEDAWNAFKTDRIDGEYVLGIDLSEKILARIGGEVLRAEAAVELCRRLRSSYFLGCEQAMTAHVKKAGSGPAPSFRG